MVKTPAEDKTTGDDKRTIQNTSHLSQLLSQNSKRSVLKSQMIDEKSNSFRGLNKYENNSVEEPQIQTHNMHNLMNEDLENVNFELKSPTSHAIMKSSLIDKANREMRKHKTKIVIGEKRRAGAASTQKELFENTTAHRRKKPKEASSMLLLKSHNQAPKPPQNLKSHNSFTKLIPKSKSRPRTNSQKPQSQPTLNPIRLNAHSMPPSNLILPTPSPQNASRLPPRKAQKQLPLLKQIPHGVKKNVFLVSLRKENGRIRDELKEISRQLSVHIGKQLKQNANGGRDGDGRDGEKEMKVLEGSLVNAHKRYENTEVEHRRIRCLMVNEGKLDK